MELLENISKQELNSIKELIGEAFVSNELFHEFGDIQSRKALVMKYMNVYVDYVYESNALYATSDRKAFIGLIYSDKQPIIPKVKMLFRIISLIPFSILKKYMNHVKQIANQNKKYSSEVHVDILFICVSKEYQGKGYARQLVDFAKKQAENRKVPLLLDTDMEKYAGIYQHYGCELYNKKTADNGVTRYNLVWKEYDKYNINNKL